MSKEILVTIVTQFIFTSENPIYNYFLSNRLHQEDGVVSVCSKVKSCT